MADHDWPGATLVAAAQRGDAEALTALVYGSYPHVQRFARTLSATPQDAEDAAQDRHEPPDAYEAYEASGTARSAEEDVLLRLEAERVGAAVAALPADQRQVLVMRDIQGLPGRTVADRLGLSTAAMKSRLHHARSAAREALREEPTRTRGAGHDT
ncbi:sigma factor-like helix-turn-helix DNA-binding protein [Streptomyces sp. NPDC029003]|uniref:RNA polymerase sigma factor n=1 Tax=Streptomyces sp. NPDC029003 TaxID=3155125 RepID=UPI0033ECE3F5